jgi:hypothetical protein
MSESATSLRTDDTLIHLPIADSRERDAVWEHMEKMAEALPMVEVTVSARAVSELPKRWSSQREMFILVEALTETLLDSEVEDVSPELAAQLGFFTGLAMIPETMALQIAFGRKVAEEQSRTLARIAEQAQRRGLSVDEYVVALRAANAVPHDELVRLFHGETGRAPSAHRLRHGITLLRRVAGMLPVAARPSVLCVIAWLMWARERRPIAMAYLAEASRIEPEHLLAFGLSAVLDEKKPAWAWD